MMWGHVIFGVTIIFLECDTHFLPFFRKHHSKLGFKPFLT